MTVATVASRALAGIDAPEVTVEVHLGPGLPAFHIVGLPDAEVREARDRVRAALNHVHFEFPARRITVNLAPAELPKDSSRFDLPIALGILAASGQLAPQALAGLEFAGELSLTGELPGQQQRDVLHAPPEDPHVEERVAEIAGHVAAEAEDEWPGQCRRKRRVHQGHRKL